MRVVPVLGVGDGSRLTPARRGIRLPTAAGPLLAGVLQARRGGPAPSARAGRGGRYGGPGTAQLGQDTLTHLPQSHSPSAHVWTRTDLTPADVALLYDGFTFNVVSWMEGLGFCGPGEATDFIAGGTTIALDGELPLNPHGGQLSASRLHGYGFVREAMLQLRGEARGRQVDGAGVAVVTSGGGVPSGVLLLRSAG